MRSRETLEFLGLLSERQLTARNRDVWRKVHTFYLLKWFTPCCNVLNMDGESHMNVEEMHAPGVFWLCAWRCSKEMSVRDINMLPE